MSRPDRAHKYASTLVTTLLGGTVTGTGVRKDPLSHDEYWLWFDVEFKDGQVLRYTVSRDPEGNGPGTLFLEEVKK